MTHRLLFVLGIAGVFTKNVYTEKREKCAVPLLQTWMPWAELRDTAAVKLSIRFVNLRVVTKLCGVCRLSIRWTSARSEASIENEPLIG